MKSARAELDRYFEMIHRRVPMKVARFIRWLRKPSSFWIRLLVALLFVLGGVFSFLPILGLWMLPLGLLFIAQDLPILQTPLANALRWIESKLSAAWRKRKSRDGVAPPACDESARDPGSRRRPF
ncbi:hypothetical protein ACVWVY_003735 [Bradyrhizobium sp. URHC0002]